MVAKKSIIEATQLIEYFRERVQDACTNQGLKPSEMAEFYIVNLLRDFRSSEKLFTEEKGSRLLKPLAQLLIEAIEGDTAARMKNLKQLGDTALYTAGFFPEMIKRRRLVGPNYFISMGEGAYSSLSSILSGEKTFSEIYGELAEQFSNFVGILMEVAAGEKTNSNILRLYEQWLETGDARIESLLRREGIIPDTTPGSTGGILQ